MMTDNPEVEIPKSRSRGLKLGRLFVGKVRSPSPNPLRGTSPPVSPTSYTMAPLSPTSNANFWKKQQQYTSRDEEELIPKRNQVNRSNTNAAAFTFDTHIIKRTEKRKTISTLEDLLNCSICSRRFIDPKMLRCQHTFCSECLQEKIVFGTGRNNILLTCPECNLQEKLSIQAPEQIHSLISKLPSNLYINSLLNVMQGMPEAQKSPKQPTADADDMQARCCKCQTACDTKNCAHCKQVFCAVCWSSHVSELQGQLQDLEEQLSAAKEKLEHRTADFKLRCEELETSIQTAVEAKREALRVEEVRLKAEASHFLETAQQDAEQLFKRLNETTDVVVRRGGINPQTSDENKVATFLSLHKMTAELLEEVSHWGEMTPMLDFEMSKIEMREDGEHDDDDAECKDEVDSSKMQPELINNEEDMALYYRTRLFTARMLLGNMIIYRPGGVSLCPWGPPNHLYVAGNDNRQVIVFDVNKGSLHKRIQATNMIFPHGLTFCAKRQEMYVTDKWGHCIHVFDKEGNFCRTMCSKGHGEGQLRSPEGIAIGPDPDNPKDTLLYVCDTNNDRLQVLRPGDGSVVRVIGIEEASRKEGKYRVTEFNQPSGVAVSGDTLVVTDYGNSKVKVFSSLGEKRMDLGVPGSFKSPECVAIDRLGSILVGDSGNARVQVFTSGGKLVRVFGKRGSSPGKLRWVSGLHVANNMDIFVTDFRNHCILVF